MNCRHQPVCSGRRITAEWAGKGNRPDDSHPVASTGWEASCAKCGWPLIVHDSRYGYPMKFTELEKSMQMTDHDLKVATTSAQISIGIEAAQKLIVDILKAETEFRARRLAAETWLGELIAAKLMMDQTRRI